jgi:hypothetical protein
MGRPKCSVCSYAMLAQEYLMHTWCYRILQTRGGIRDTKALILCSREMTNRAREAIRRQEARQKAGGTTRS